MVIIEEITPIKWKVEFYEDRSKYNTWVTYITDVIIMILHISIVIMLNKSMRHPVPDIKRRQIASKTGATLASTSKETLREFWLPENRVVDLYDLTEFAKLF